MRPLICVFEKAWRENKTRSKYFPQMLLEAAKDIERTWGCRAGLGVGLEGGEEPGDSLGEDVEPGGCVYVHAHARW